MSAPAGDGPDFEAVLDWVEGRLDAAAAEPVERAVADGDARVVGIVEWATGFRELAARVSLPVPPPTLRPRLEAVFERWAAERARSAPLHISLRLVFDSRQDLVRAGVRAADPDDATVHLAYTSDEAEVVLDVERLTPATVRVRGQVLQTRSSSATGVVAEASGPRAVTSSPRGDSLGRFELSRVPDDADELRLDDGEVVLVAALDLRGCA